MQKASKQRPTRVTKPNKGIKSHTTQHSSSHHISTKKRQQSKKTTLHTSSLTTSKTTLSPTHLTTQSITTLSSLSLQDNNTSPLYTKPSLLYSNKGNGSNVQMKSFSTFSNSRSQFTPFGSNHLQFDRKVLSGQYKHHGEELTNHYKSKSQQSSFHSFTTPITTSFNTTPLPSHSTIIPHSLNKTTTPKRKQFKLNQGFKKGSHSVFHPTTPQHSPARILAIAGALGMVLGARYIGKACLAFYQAYKNTNQSFEPVGEEQILEAHNELVQAAEEVTALAEQQDQEISIKKQKAEALQAKTEKEKRLKEQGLDGFDDIGTNKPKFFQDDFSDHIDVKARDLRKKQEEQRELNMIRYESNEAEIEMNEIFYLNELILRGDGSGFNEPQIDILEAERILQIAPGACLEELRERHHIMMRLNHPDLGGSPYLALKVSEAFDLLKISAKSSPEWARKRQQEKSAEEAARKQAAEEILKEQLIKEGVLDEQGDFKHPDGNIGKKHD